MSELDLQSLVNQINGCTENEKRIILSQLAKNDIYLLIESFYSSNIVLENAITNEWEHQLWVLTHYNFY